MAAPQGTRRRRGDERARVMALTRAAYTVAEGGLPGTGEDEEEPIESERRTAGRPAPARHGTSRAMPPASRRRARRLSPRAALAAAVALALATAFLVVRAAVTTSSVVEVPPVAPSAAEPVVEVPADDGGDPSEEGAGAPPDASDPTAVPTDTAAPGGAPAPATTVVVHVSGHVLAPGVVTLAAGARVHEAVAATGGADGEADLDALNLARVLVDGEQVHVPAVGESAPPVVDAGGSGVTPGSPTTPGSVAGPTGRVNLNTATLAELDALPGIGPAIAQRVIDWREANDGFRDVAELDEVSGIGPSLMGSLRDLVTV
ncbi:competence protein ComEA [Serinibacter arcticus]|uniref:Competence protein ComEA n=1 Tax=Serinibacter arcticus TaxID=1655435 RepID=A0A2U1ZR35_9MICO|nr:ComEA family DNA-binding protein [Serinibacter arcticus]PWD49464.1 competence protein ComEA [Serinibacter arcticus]